MEEKLIDSGGGCDREEENKEEDQDEKKGTEEEEEVIDDYEEKENSNNSQINILTRQTNMVMNDGFRIPNLSDSILIEVASTMYRTRITRK